MLMWWPVVFWVLLVPLMIVLSITYATTKKLFRLVQILALFTYVIFITYLIDVFALSKNWILALLFISTLLIIGAGVYVARQTKKKGMSKRSQRNWRIGFWMVFGVTVLLIIIGLIGGAFVHKTTTAPVTITPDMFENDAVVTVFEARYENSYFLPVAIPYQDMQLCGRYEDGIRESYELWPQISPDLDRQIELAPSEAKTVQYQLSGQLKPVRTEGEGEVYVPLRATEYILIENEPNHPLNCDEYERYDYYVIPVAE